MENIIISTAAQVSYKYNGLFESSSPDWIHMSRTLKEYQLIIVTEGTLHIADSEKDYTVNQNEYLIMKPGHQYGTASTAALPPVPIPSLMTATILPIPSQKYLKWSPQSLPFPQIC